MDRNSSMGTHIQELYIYNLLPLTKNHQACPKPILHHDNVSKYSVRVTQQIEMLPYNQISITDHYKLNIKGVLSLKFVLYDSVCRTECRPLWGDKNLRYLNICTLQKVYVCMFFCLHFLFWVLNLIQQPKN